MAAMSDDDVKQRIEKEVTLEHSTQRAPEHALKNRLLFHIAHKVWSRAPLTPPPQKSFSALLPTSDGRHRTTLRRRLMIKTSS